MATPTLASPLIVEIGRDWSWAFSWETAVLDANGLQTYDDAGKPMGVPVDLTGHAVSARMQVRAEVDSPVVLLELTSDDGGGIAVDLPAGRFSLAIPSEDTATLLWTSGVADVLVSVDGDDRTLIRFGVKVVKPVTRV